MIRRVLFSIVCSLSFTFMSGAFAQQVPPMASTPSQDHEKLLNETLNFARGHQEFKDLFFKQHEADFVRLIKEGQSPQTLFIGCSDSRVVPELILNAHPGELFVIRTAGNFVNPYQNECVDGVAATLQYAIEDLNVRHIIVCGHSHCGAIRGLFQKLDSEQLGILKRWLKLGEEAKEMTLKVVNPGTPKEEIYSITEEVSVIFQLEHLMSFPFIKKRVQEGKLELHGWYFKIETGELWYYNTEQYRFIPLIEKTK